MEEIKKKTWQIGLSINFFSEKSSKRKQNQDNYYIHGIANRLSKASISGTEVIRTEKCFSLPLENVDAWAAAVQNSDVKCENQTVRTLDEYDMRREIKRLEKLYLGW